MKWRRLSELSPWRFVLAIWLINVCSMIPLQIIYLVLNPRYHFFETNRLMDEVIDKLGRWWFLVLAGVIWPWIETFIGQGIPWMITRLLRLPASVFLAVSTVGFALLHGWGFSGPDFWLMFLGHLIAAFLLAYTFLQGEKRSDWRAIWMTASVHMLSNLVVGFTGELGALVQKATG